MSDPLCKICGLRRKEDVLLCRELGVDFTGFIFVRSSSRFVEPEDAAALPGGPAAPLPPGGPRRVGVFAGSSLKEVLRIADTAGLDLLQLHGNEDEAFCRAAGPKRVIKTLRPQNLTRRELEKTMRRFAPVCAWFLLDAGQSGGGSGNTLDWQSLAGLAPPRPWLLAGGLGPATLNQALAACSPDGLDLNSALESAPGVKNHELTRRAVALIRSRK